MTLLGFDGLTAATSRVLPEWAPTGVWDTSAAGRDGSANGSATLDTNHSMTWMLAAPIPACYVGFGYIGALGAQGTAHRLVGFMAATGLATQIVLIVNLAGMLEARRTSSTGALLATSSGHVPLTAAAWHHYQVHCTLHTTTGRFVVRLDGMTTPVMDFTGATSTVNSDIHSMTLGGSTARWDDWWVCDGVDATATQGRPNNTFLGDLKVQALLPTADGDSTTWTPNTAVANWTTVDEVVPSSADYVSGAASSGLRDLYQISDLPALTAAVFGVRQFVHAATSDAGAAFVTPVMKENGVVTTDGSRALSMTYAAIAGSLRTKRPSDGANWTVANVNALQVGQDAA